jgi:hypothetical protein
MGKRANGQGAVYLRGDGSGRANSDCRPEAANRSTRGLAAICSGSCARPTGCSPKGCQSVREIRP